jgi:hypothetical protein
MPRKKKDDTFWGDKVKKSAGLPVEPKKKIVRKKKMPMNREKELHDIEELRSLNEVEITELDELKGRINQDINTMPIFTTNVIVKPMTVSANGFTLVVPGTPIVPVVNPVPGQDFVVTTTYTSAAGPVVTDIMEFQVPLADKNSALDLLNGELESVQAVILAQKV